MLLAVLHRHAGMPRAFGIFVNAVGGVKIDEPAADLPVLLAIIASLRNKPPDKLVAFGEIGLAGEVRPVQRGQERLGKRRNLVGLAIIEAMRRNRRSTESRWSP
jgi:DNA repair protein RadA/Sms